MKKKSLVIVFVFRNMALCLLCHKTNRIFLDKTRDLFSSLFHFVKPTTTTTISLSRITPFGVEFFVWNNRMIRLFLALVPVAAAFGAENKNVSLSNEVLDLNFKDHPVNKILNIPISLQNFSLFENIIFLNEVQECRSKHQKIDDYTFYKHVYCSLKNENYISPDGISCNITKLLIEIIQKKLNDFEMFRVLSNKNESCGENNFRPKRNSLDSDLVEIMGERPKETDKRYIYLGPTRFPMTTDIHNRLYRADAQLIDGRTSDEKKPAAEGVRKKKTKGKHKSKRKIKPIKVSPNNFFHMLKLFKFRKLRQHHNGVDFINTKTFTSLDDTSDPSDELRANTFFYFKLFETFLNIVGQFYKYTEEERSKELMHGENQEIGDITEEEKTEERMEEEKKETEEEERVETEEENSSIRPGIVSSYRADPPELYYTLSWKYGTKVK